MTAAAEHGGACVRAHGLTVRYETRRKPALQDVSLRVEPGERVLLGGRSGSGKSTLALCLAGLVPSSVDAEAFGMLEVAGVSLLGHRRQQTPARVGIVFQDPASQFTMLTVADEVAFGLENHGVAPARMRRQVDEALEAVGLADRAAWRLDRLSGGQQQRVVLAAALALEPDLLVLDEPTSHLDPASAAQIYADLASLVEERGVTMVVTEHRIDLVSELASSAAILDSQGQVSLDGRLPDLLGEPAAVSRWAALGVAVPASVALACALGHTDAALPRTTDAAVRWLREDGGAQRRLRAAEAGVRRRTPGDVVLRASDLDVRYTRPQGSTAALRGLDLTVRAGELVAVVGRNGSGKSTLLRTLSGLIPPSRGEVTVDGRALSRLDAPALAGTVGHVFQDPESGFVSQTVADELAYGPRALGWSETRTAEYVAAATERFGLAGVERASPWTLSGGQKRRLSVAVALLTGPRALMLDEPTFGQDPQTASALAEDIAGLVDDGLAVVVATHDPTFAYEQADRVIGLVDGAIVFDGSPAELFGDVRLCERTGQRPPPLAELLSAARAAGVDVPLFLRWREVAGRGLQ